MPNVTTQALITEAFIISRLFYTASSGNLSINLSGRSGTPSGLGSTDGGKDVKWIVVPIPIASPLTAAEAVTDGRKVALTLIRALVEGYSTLSPSQRPNTIKVERATPIALSENSVRQSFTFTVDLNIGPADVAVE
jgi:hypothetical protein